MMTFTILLRTGCTRVVNARFVLAIAAVILAVADAFHARAPIPLRTIATPRKLSWARTASSGDTSGIMMMSTATAASTTTTAAVTPEAALDPIIQELRARIVEAPEPLEGNRESQRHADEVISTTFEVDCDGNLLGGDGQELRLATALALDTFVVRKTTTTLCSTGWLMPTHDSTDECVTRRQRAKFNLGSGDVHGPEKTIGTFECMMCMTRWYCIVQLTSALRIQRPNINHVMLRPALVVLYSSSPDITTCACDT